MLIFFFLASHSSPLSGIMWFGGLALLPSLQEQAGDSGPPARKPAPIRGLAQ